MRRQIADNGIFLLRVSVAIMMLSHGVPKALDYEQHIATFPDPLNVGTEISAMLILFAEVGCSILLLIGLLGRFAAATLFVAMMVAAFVFHFPDPWSDKELPLLYAAIFACLTLTGPGSTSIDGWFARRVFETEGPPDRAPRSAERGAPP
ncbi:MAG: DoxX family protein [Myxococcota bacterium]